MYYILYTIAYHTMNQKSSVMHSVMEYNLIFFVFLVDIMKRFLGKANLPVYPNAGKRGMKLYTDGEITRATGYERLYRKFWNQKAEEICSNKVLAQWTQTAIEGIITTEWTMKKTPLMYTHAMELMSKDYPENGKRRQKGKTVIINAMEMLRVHKRLLHLDEKLRQLRDPSNKERNKKRKIEETEMEVKAMLSKLKGIQESLRKAMENMAREKSIKNVELSSEMEVDTHQLNSEEIRMLLRQIEDKDKGSFSTDDLLQANGKRKRESSESSSEVSVEEDKVSISVGEDNSPTTNA